MGSKGHRDATVGPANGTCNQCRHQKVTAAPAVHFWYRNTRIPLFRQALPYPGWKIIGALYFRIMGSNFVLRESICAFISELMLFWKFKIHKVAVLSDTAERHRTLCSVRCQSGHYKRQHHLGRPQGYARTIHECAFCLFTRVLYGRTLAV